MKTKLFIIASLLLIIIVVALYQSESKPQTTPSKASPLKAWLRYFPGTNETPALVALTLINNNDNDISPAERLKLNKAADLAVEYKLEWQITSSDKKATRPLVVEALKEARHNKSESLLVFAIKQTNTPKPGEFLNAKLLMPTFAVNSNRIIVPTPPKNELFRLQRQARVYEILKEYDQLEQCSAELIKLYPESSTGYYFKSLVLEHIGEKESALEAAKLVIKYLPDPNTPSKQGHRDLNSKAFENLRRLKKLKD